MSIREELARSTAGGVSRRGLLAGTAVAAATAAVAVANSGSAAAATTAGVVHLTDPEILGDLDGVADNFRRTIVHEMAIHFPGYAAQAAAKGLMYFYPQSLWIYEGKVYILYAGAKSDHSPGGSWVSVHDWTTGDYLRGFHLGIPGYGEGIVVKWEASVLALYARSAAGVMGRWNITTLPAEGGTLAVSDTYTVGLQSQFTWSSESDLWLIQKNDRASTRHRFKRTLGAPSFDLDADVNFDASNMMSVDSDVSPHNVKAQGICAWGSGYAAVYGGAFEFHQTVTPNKYCGIRTFSGSGELLSDGIMHPMRFAEILGGAGATVGIMEAEGCATYEGRLYALWVTQHWDSSGDHTGDFGLVITQEMAGEIDCSTAAAPGRLANLDSLQSRVAFEASGVRNPITGTAFTTLSQILEFMRDTALTRWGLYTTGTALTDMDGNAIASGQFMEISTGNFASWDITLRGSTRVRRYWVITDPGYSGDVQQDVIVYHLSESQWIGGGSQSPQGSVSAAPGCMWIRTNGDLWVKASGTGNTGWVLK